MSRLGKVYTWIVCVILLLIHIPGAVAGRILSAKMMPLTFDMFYSTVETPEGVSVEGKTLVVVNAPNPTMFMAMPALRAWNDEPLPGKVRLLSPGFGPMTITRTGENSLTIRSDQDDLFSVKTEKVYYYPHLPYVYEHFNLVARAKDAPFQQGQTIRLPDMNVEILGTDDEGICTEIEATFDTPLEDANRVWLQWNWKKSGAGEYSIFTHPAIGESVSLAGPE